jgi:hypothetical protein
VLCCAACDTREPRERAFKPCPKLGGGSRELKSMAEDNGRMEGCHLLPVAMDNYSLALTAHYVKCSSCLPFTETRSQ